MLNITREEAGIEDIAFKIIKAAFVNKCRSSGSVYTKASDICLAFAPRGANCIRVKQTRMLCVGPILMDLTETFIFSFIPLLTNCFGVSAESTRVNKCGRSYLSPKIRFYFPPLPFSSTDIYVF